ncbi:MAG: hypothetical protein ACYC1D_16005 [Acidimicrobiales bacterium]
MNGQHDDEAVLLLPDDPRVPVPVTAGELLEWGWLLDGLAGWFTELDQDARAGYRRRFGDDPFAPATLPALIETLDRIHRRIGWLLDEAGAQR